MNTRVAAILFPLLILSARSDVLVSNLEERWNHEGIGILDHIHGDRFHALAGAFRTGSNPSVLSSITVEHGHYPEVPLEPGFRLLLFALPEVTPPRSNVPIIAELSNPTLNPSPTQFPGFTQRVDYSSLNPVILEADTTYWVAPFLDPGSSAVLMAVHSTREQGVPGWSIGDHSRRGFADGLDVTWQTESSVGLDILKFSINGTVVPEPATWAFVLLGSSILLFHLRRTRADR